MFFQLGEPQAHVFEESREVFIVVELVPFYSSGQKLVHFNIRYEVSRLLLARLLRPLELWLSGQTELLPFAEH